MFQSAVIKVVEATLEQIGAGDLKACEKEKREAVISELINLAVAAGWGALLFSHAHEWAEDAAALLREILSCKEAVQTIEKKYFDGHAILYPNVEGALGTTIEATLETVSLFNRYVRTEVNAPAQDSERQTPLQDPKPTASKGETSPPRLLHVSIAKCYDQSMTECLINEWVSNARQRGTADILKETGEYDSYVWRCLAEKYAPAKSPQ